MPRPTRNFHPGGIYHITHRGHNKFHIFEESIDKATFLDIVRKVVTETGGYILYYVVMDNHYHILFEMQDTMVDKVMHRINSRYANYYSNKIKLNGSVFGNRYFSQEVLNKKYLSAVIQYLAVNPVKAGLVQKIHEYHWCAHTELVNRKQEVLSSQRFFEHLGESIEQGKAHYAALIVEAQKKIEISIPIDLNQKSQRMSVLEDMLFSFLSTYKRKMTIAQIQAPTRDRIVFEARRTFAKIAYDQGHSISDIARILGVSYRSVDKWFKDDRIK